MDVRFKNNDDRRCYENITQATRRWGPVVAKKYNARIRSLLYIQTLDELRELPGLRVHPLKGNRDGQWSLTIHDRWRLIFLHSEADGVEIADVQEVSNHYED